MKVQAQERRASLETEIFFRCWRSYGMKLVHRVEGLIQVWGWVRCSVHLCAWNSMAAVRNCGVGAKRLPVSVKSWIFLHDRRFFFKVRNLKTKESIQGIHARLGRATHERNTAWTPQYEGSVSEAWAYILKRRRNAIVACNTYIQTSWYSGVVSIN
jgi:hypothetical protein